MNSASTDAAARRTRGTADLTRATRRLRHLPWTAITLSVLVLLAAAVAVAPIRDAASGGAIDEAQLTLPATYLALSPAFDLLDTLTLLSVRQHIALLVTLLLAWALVRGWPRRRVVDDAGATRPPFGARAKRETLLGIAYLAAIVAVYAVMALVPRPMARLVLNDLDVLTVDVHAHTQYSHDGRKGRTPEKLRQWSARAGYDVVYVSDHRTFEGIEEAVPNNPSAAGAGTVMLPALEAVWHGERVNILSAGSIYKGLTDDALRDVDDKSLTLASLVRGKEPVLVQTVPANLSRIIPHRGPGTAGVRAIEVVDGGPRGLGQTRRDRARIVRLADSLNLALVAGSDNHGYGSTAPGWTLLRVVGWRNASPPQIAESVESTIRNGGRAATRVAERVVEDPGDSVLRLVLTAPLVLWRLLMTLSLEQRLMWVIWAWAITLVSVTWRRGRARRKAAAGAR